MPLLSESELASLAHDQLNAAAAIRMRARHHVLVATEAVRETADIRALPDEARALIEQALTALAKADVTLRGDPPRLRPVG